jgi:hypothetical protein
MRETCYVRNLVFEEPLIGRMWEWRGCPHHHRHDRAIKDNGEQVGFQSMAYVASWRNPRVRAAFAAIALSQFAAIAHSSEGSFDDFPFLVHCEVCIVLSICPQLAKTGLPSIFRRTGWPAP